MHRGSSIIELLVTITIFGIILLAVATFQTAIFRSHATYEERSKIDQESLIAIRSFTKDLRTAQQSGLGSYPIEAASDDELIFYSDRGSDGIIERLRYWRDGDELKRGIIIPSGDPLTYNPANESVGSILTGVTNATPTFTYYGEDYNGVDAVDPLTEPIAIAAIRHVKIEFDLTSDKGNVLPINVSTNITIRNLRDF